MAELVDALDSGSSRGNSVDVRVILAALFLNDEIHMLSVANTIALVANGSIDDLATIKPLVLSHEYIIAVDGGLAHCDAMNIVPNLIIGDFDSITKELQKKFAKTEGLCFPTHKDETDLELALKKVYNPDINHITIFGALGNRADHTLYNLHLLRRYPKKVRIETEYELIFSIAEPTEIACSPGQTISFLPLGEPVTGITTKGLQWELHDAVFDKNFMSISNICLTNSVQISLKNGDLLCFLQKSL